VTAFVELASIAPQQLVEGLLARAVHGDRITLAVVEIDPDTELPEHSHENEQLGLVLRGSVTFRVGDETQVVAAGGVWRIPSNTPHFLRAGSEGAVVVDVFTPSRDEWRRLEELAPRPPEWP
jgi:quercetin dioxygenase-like cupin family protein